MAKKEAYPLVQRGDEWVVENVSTPAGNPVSGKNKEMMRAIAAEGAERELTAYEFGVFSAFCTCADALSGQHHFRGEIMAELVESDHLVGEGCGRDEASENSWGCGRRDYKQRYGQTLREAFRKLGWEPAVLDDPKANRERILAWYSDYFDGLSEIKQTAVILYNGMNRAEASMLLLNFEGLLHGEGLTEMYDPNPEPLMEQMAVTKTIERWLALEG